MDETMNVITLCSKEILKLGVLSVVDMKAKLGIVRLKFSCGKMVRKLVKACESTKDEENFKK